MITNLRIQNFKGWQDTGQTRMAPISLFFGVNSSGKSSIGQFLMMLKQTAESPDRKAVFYPGGKNSSVQLGSFLEMVFHRDTSNRVVFDYSWDLWDPIRFKDSRSNRSYTSDAIDFAAEVGIGDTKQHVLVVDRLHYCLRRGDEQTMSIGMERKSPGKSEYRVSADGYDLVRKRGRGWAPGSPVRFYGFPDEVVAYHQNADFVQELNLAHEKLFRSLCYLGPLRTKAERLYSWTGIEPESVGSAGENTIAAILAARNRKLSMGYRCRARPFEHVIAEKLKQMGLIEEFQVNPISEQRQEYEVKVRTTGSKDWVDLPDVGFGISQVLPVLVQCFYAPPGSIILMEQPEIHLHPSAQAALADVMIDAIQAREGGHDRSIQLVVETHSEHFLRRLQRRVAESVIPQSKVAAYFADITRSPATLTPLEMDIFGTVKNWPPNFFGDEMGDIAAQAKAAMLKRKEQGASNEDRDDG